MIFQFQKRTEAPAVTPPSKRYCPPAVRFLQVLPFPAPNLAPTDPEPRIHSRMARSFSSCRFNFARRWFSFAIPISSFICFSFLDFRFEKRAEASSMTPPSKRYCPPAVRFLQRTNHMNWSASTILALPLVWYLPF